jgi:hypothetical protein
VTVAERAQLESIPDVFRKRRGDGTALVDDMSFLIREPADAYHAQSARYLTSHRLAEFRRNPPLFRKKELGFVREEDRPAYLIGRAAHVLILEGREAYEREYAFGGPINEKTGAPFGSRTKAFQEWAQAQGKPVLDDEQAALIENLNGAVHAHEHAAALLADGVAEGVVRAEYCGVACQARLDWLNPERGIVDLKTADSLDWLETDARSYRYAHQIAFYRALVACVIGSSLPAYLIAAEKREPFRVGVWRMGQDVLGIAQNENEEAIARLVRSRATDTWPSGYEELREFDWL